MTTGTNEQLPKLDNGEIVQANGVDLCVETFGNAADPAILLVHGAATSMHGWEDEFCQRLADGPRFVIRYDQRDTGRSVSYPPGAPGYTPRDLVADVVGLLDVFEIDRAHLVGISMGGGIVTGAALDYPDRVASLTLMATSTGGPDLPPMSEEFIAFVSRPEQPDWSDREAVIDHMIEFLHICAGPRDQIDEAVMREQIGQDLDRTTNVASSQINHFAMDISDSRDKDPSGIGVPVLVIHGDQDPIFPLGHGKATAEKIPNARLLVLEQTAHLMNRPTWDTVIPAILQHTRRDS